MQYGIRKVSASGSGVFGAEKVFEHGQALTFYRASWPCKQIQRVAFRNLLRKAGCAGTESAFGKDGVKAAPAGSEMPQTVHAAPGL